MIFVATTACSRVPEPPPVQRWGRNTGPVVVRTQHLEDPSALEFAWVEREIETLWTRAVDDNTETLTSPQLPFDRAESVGTIEIAATVGEGPGGLDVMWSDTPHPEKQELLTARRFFPYGGGEGPRMFRLTGAQITDVYFAAEERGLRHLFLRYSPGSLKIRSVRISPRSAHPSEFEPVALGGEIRDAVAVDLPATLEASTLTGEGSSIRFGLAARVATSVEVSITATERDQPDSLGRTIVQQAELGRGWSMIELPVAPLGRANLRIELKGEPSTQVYCSRPIVLRTRTDRPPNVVLYVVDALRAADLSCYGSQWETSPFLDQLASRGVLFENCAANCSWTKPSVTSLLTSLSPQVHGLGSRSHGDALPSTVVTLQRSLGEAGYLTGSFSANPLASNLSNLHIGFDVAMTPNSFVRREPSGKVGSEELTDALIEWMTDQRERPFFAYVHSMDPHTPLTEWDAPAHIGSGESRPRDFYLREIFHNDLQIQRIYRWLEEHDLDRTTLFIVTADHGESFEEHGTSGHGTSTYQEEIHVPLIVVHPDRLRPRRDTRSVQLVDVMPTILEHCALDFEIEGGRGVGLFGPGRGGTDRPVFSTRFAYPLDRVLWEDPYRETYAVREGRWKLVVRGTPPEETTELELFDLDRDPREQHDLSTEEAATASRLLAELTQYLTDEAGSRERFTARHLRAIDKTSMALSTREKTDLEALGYVVE
jgi:arylsulfatase A-like enzyme